MVGVNAKNSYGGYTGFKTRFLWIGPDGTVKDAFGSPVQMLEIVEIIDVNGAVHEVKSAAR